MLILENDVYFGSLVKENGEDITICASDSAMAVFFIDCIEAIRSTLVSVSS